MAPFVGEVLRSSALARVTSVSAQTWLWWVAGVVCAFAWVASLVTGDTSWVDHLWSLLPAIYLIIFAAHDNFAST